MRAITSNIKKAYQVLRKDGVAALMGVLYYRVVTGLGWRMRNFWQARNIKPGASFSTSKYRLVLFSSVPYDDVGGGQRSAQLARAALRAGMQVLYVYIYPKYDFMKQRNVISTVRLPNLIHLPIRYLTEAEFNRFINENTTVLFEIPHPHFIKYLETAQVKGIRTVFELIDDWETSLGGDWFQQDVLHSFVQNCSVVTGTARRLVEKLIAAGREDAIYLPNAANEYVFNRQNQYPRPVDLSAGKLVLYFGSLYGEWFGWSYIQAAAEANPDLNFCLIGSKPPEIPVMLPQNVYFLGEKQNAELPAYLSKAEFCLLPFMPGKLTDSVSPIKVFEYLFMAKPVVSSFMVEVKDLPNVHTAHNESEFANLCAQLKIAGAPVENGRYSTEDFIAHNSWFARLQRIIHLEGNGDVSAVILMHNNRTIIARCLKSLLENCSTYLAEVIVVDNASQDGGAEYVEQNFPQVRLVRNPVNGCSSGRNLGVKQSTGKYLAFFDSDQWFTGGFCFEEALSILQAHPDIGAVGWAAGWLELGGGQLQGSVVDYYPRRGMNARAALQGYRTDIAYLGTGGLFLSRAIFEAAGGLDKAYDPTCFEDTDLSFSIKKLGYKIAYRDLSCLQHEAHQTTTASEDSPAYRQLYARNQAYLIEKWKDYPHFYKKYAM